MIRPSLMSESEILQAEKFSSQYDVISGIDILSHDGERAIMERELFFKLAEAYGENFMALIGGRHYLFEPSGSMPSKTVAVPDSGRDFADSFLVKR